MAPESEESILNEISEQRKFLHDLASPLSTSIFLVDSAMRAAKAAPTPDPALISKLEKMAQVMDKMKTMLQDRRAVPISKVQREAA